MGKIESGIGGKNVPLLEASRVDLRIFKDLFRRLPCPDEVVEVKFGSGVPYEIGGKFGNEINSESRIKSNTAIMIENVMGKVGRRPEEIGVSRTIGGIDIKRNVIFDEEVEKSLFGAVREVISGGGQDS